MQLLGQFIDLKYELYDGEMIRFGLFSVNWDLFLTSWPKKSLFGYFLQMRTLVGAIFKACLTQKLEKYIIKFWSPEKFLILLKFW